MPGHPRRRHPRTAPLLFLGAWLIHSTSIGAETPLAPPGDCSEAQHKQLKEEVGRACKATSMKCQEHQGCAELLVNWLKYQRCINARTTLMTLCFRGGDDAHRKEVDNYKRGADECSKLMASKRCPEQCR